MHILDKTSELLHKYTLYYISYLHHPSISPSPTLGGIAFRRCHLKDASVGGRNFSQDTSVRRRILQGIHWHTWRIIPGPVSS